MVALQSRSAFTLIELAIVLVIIGLIVGGVLVGQDLIKAAQIRAVTTDIDRYNTAANAFQTKYGGIPGDLLSVKAQNNGLCYSTGAAGMGDGDGMLSNAMTDPSSTSADLGGENLLFWLHLSQAQMIPFSPVGTSGTAGYPGSGHANQCTGTALAPVDTTPPVTYPKFQALMPTTRIRDSSSVYAFGMGGQNYFTISDFTKGSQGIGDAIGFVTTPAVLTPREAQGIDTKLDDGHPDRGIVISASQSGWELIWVMNACVYTFPGTMTSPAALDCGDSTRGGACYDDTTLGQGFYMTKTNAQANAIACSLIIRASF